MEKNWTSEAACSGMPTSMFTVSRRGEPEVAHLGGNTIKIGSHNRSKINAAIEVCKGCPVRAACVESALPTDLYWTVRGGRVPEYYPYGLGGRTRSSRGDVPSFPATDFIEFKCFKGKHVGDRFKGLRLNASSGNMVQYCTGCNGGSGDVPS